MEKSRTAFRSISHRQTLACGEMLSYKYTFTLSSDLENDFFSSYFRQASKAYFIPLLEICTEDIAILSPFNLHLLASGCLSAARH